mgnify:FL=1
MNVVHASATLLLLSSLMVSCAKPPLPVEPGVSLALAKHRVETISGINYELSLTIPESPDENIDGRVIITFQLSDSSQPLQLDFR